METTKFRDYFLGKLSPSEAEALEIEIISNAEIEAELQVAESALNEDYLDETLNSEDKTAFEQNYLITKSRREQVEIIHQLKIFSQKTLVPDATPSFLEQLKAAFSLRPIMGALVAVALILAIGFGYLNWKNYSSTSEILVSLNKAYKNERPTEARITDLDYAAKTEGTRGGNQAENLDLVMAKSRATEAVLKDPSAENLHELGRVYLAENNYDEAMRQFEKAIKLNANYAKLHNDLGVALMEKGKQKDEGKLELFAKANESIEKAIELDKDLKEAYFNRGIAIESLNLPNQAKEAWENYLKLDSSSKWADEARERLKKLEENKPISKTKEEILKEFFEAKEANDDEKAWQILSRNREMITGKLIPQQLTFLFVDNKTSGDEITANKSLEALIYVGKLEAEKSGDWFWRDLANYYRNVSDEMIPDLKEAQNLFKKGNDNCLNGKYEDALLDFESSQELFMNIKNVLDPKLIETMTTYCKTRLGKLEESNTQLTELDRICKRNNYKWLRSQALQWLGINLKSVKQFSKAISEFENANKLTDEINDDLGKALVLMSISDTYSLLGQYQKSIKYTQQNLETGKIPELSLRQKWRNLYGASSTFQQQKFFKTAILYEMEALFLAKDYLNEQTNVYTNYVNLGLLYGQLDEFGLALEFIQKGQQLSQTFADEEFQKLCFAYTNLKLGHIKRRSGNYQEASENYKKAISYYDFEELRVRSYEAHKGLLLNYLAEGDDLAFQNELPSLIKLFNEYRSKIDEEQNRNSFFDNEQDVYDIAVDYEFGKSNIITAFDYAEESRSRSLLDLQNSNIQLSDNEKQPEIRFSSNLTKPLKLNQIRAEMPEQTQLLVYSVLSEKIVIWLVTKDGLYTAKSEISSETLKERAASYLKVVSERSEMNGNVEMSRELYNLLILPIKDKLDPNKQLVIIPDKVLFHLPFATFYSDKYLVEEYKISYSPSANVFLNCSRRANEFNEKKNEALLSIGNPSFNQAEYENTLQDLPSAKTEAEAVAKGYENSMVFTEKSATKKKVKENLKNVDVFHFAGHYVVDQKAPLLSSLILAGNTKEESNLANYEIVGEKLLNTRLIVLSACDTGFERYYNGEGMIGASRTFLATDVPIVVASQWSVDSEATKELMIRFHHLRNKENLTTADALRQSQLEMLKNEKFKQPYYWGAFAMLGGYSQF